MFIFICFMFAQGIDDLKNDREIDESEIDPRIQNFLDSDYAYEPGKGHENSIYELIVCKEEEEDLKK